MGQFDEILDPETIQKVGSRYGLSEGRMKVVR